MRTFTVADFPSWHSGVGCSPKIVAGLADLWKQREPLWSDERMSCTWRQRQALLMRPIGQGRRQQSQANALDQARTTSANNGRRCIGSGARPCQPRGLVSVRSLGFYTRRTFCKQQDLPSGNQDNGVFGNPGRWYKVLIAGGFACLR